MTTKHSLLVYGESEGGPIAIFHTAKCVHKTGKSGTFFLAKAESTDGEGFLEVDVPDFGGFKKEYQVDLEADTGPIISFTQDGVHYASYYPQPTPLPYIGIVLFREAGRLLGVGFGPSMFDYHGDSAVNMTGVVECEYPKKGKKGKPVKH